MAETHEWAQGLEEIRDLIGDQFARTEPRNTAIGYTQGQLSDEERKNSWTLSERAGQATPDGMQRLLSTTDWDPEAVRDALIGYVAKHLGDPAGILAIDETGFLKKGMASAGVARQYSGTAGRVENCQIGVFVTYATKYGRTFLDRELYIPKAWIEGPERCAKAGIPAERQTMATKPEPAAAMIERVLDAGVQAQWVTGDTVYGANHQLRHRLCLVVRIMCWPCPGTTPS
uniref:IS701 family transposase n=1 Tax=Enteractinococcus helveticum TaxID=1837282 RepID=UPI00137314E1|nr:IS701 family transposase [Enteractinococcus helveticum]